jgi:hypothetical protein
MEEDLITLDSSDSVSDFRTSKVQGEQRELLKFLLFEYKRHEETKLDIMDQPLYTDVSLVTGLTDQVLESVLDNALHVHCVEDLLTLTPIFNAQHAQAMFRIINNVFGCHDHEFIVTGQESTFGHDL